MPDYSKGKIYCIKSNQTDMIYIGSSVQELNKRLIEHKSKFKKWKNGNNYYCSSFELLDKYDCYIELIENYSCNSKKELCRREGEIQLQYENITNKIIAGRTQKEYNIINAEKIKEDKKKYKIENREKILEQSRQYKIENKDKILEQSRQYTIENKDKIKEYQIQNREKILEQKKQYYLKKKLEKEQLINLEIL